MENSSKANTLVTDDTEKYGLKSRNDESLSDFSDVKELHYTHGLTKRLLHWGVEARGTTQAVPVIYVHEISSHYGFQVSHLHLFPSVPIPISTRSSSFGFLGISTSCRECFYRSRMYRIILLMFD